MDMYKGISCFPLLLKDYPVDRLLQCYPRNMSNPAIAVLANRFGVRWANLKTWTDAQQGPHAVELHFMSGPARRKGTQEQYDPWPNLSVGELNPKFEQEKWPRGLDDLITKFKDGIIRSTNSNSVIYISLELEDNLSDLAYKKLLRKFKQHFSDWNKPITWVRSPCMGGRFLPPRVLREEHGKASSLNIHVYNPDGVSVAFHDGEDYFDTMPITDLLKFWAANTKAELKFIWSANMQGVGTSQDYIYPSIFLRNYKVTDNAIKYCKEILRK